MIDWQQSNKQGQAYIGQSADISDSSRQQLHFDGKAFTLNGSPVEVKLRPKGVRVGCHLASYEAVAQLARLAELKEYV